MFFFLFRQNVPICIDFSQSELLHRIINFIVGALKMPFLVFRYDRFWSLSHVVQIFYSNFMVQYHQLKIPDFQLGTISIQET